jgi:threonine dehydrogenase-like Zn-dependent dehydrogenase
VKEATIMGAFGVTRRSYEAAIRLIESGRVPLRKLHTHDFGLGDAEQAIQTLAGELSGEPSIHSCIVPAMTAADGRRPEHEAPRP